MTKPKRKKVELIEYLRTMCDRMQHGQDDGRWKESIKRFRRYKYWCNKAARATRRQLGQSIHEARERAASDPPNGDVFLLIGSSNGSGRIRPYSIRRPCNPSRFK